MSADPFAVLADGRAGTVLRRLHRLADRQMPGLILHYLPQLPRLLLGRPIPFREEQIAGYYADKYLPLEPAQAAFCHLTARALGARTIVEFGTSFGLSTIWLAAAVRDNGGGRVVGTELVPEKAEQAARNVADAGLADFASTPPSARQARHRLHPERLHQRLELRELPPRPSCGARGGAAS